MFNVYNRHYYAEENPCLVRQQRFQRKLSINVWMGVISSILISQFLGLPPTLSRNSYIDIL